MSYNKTTTGYLVESRLKGIARTYACLNEKGLHDLIVHLTDREPSTFPVNRDGLPAICGVKIIPGLHIYQ